MADETKLNPEQQPDEKASLEKAAQDSSLEEIPEALEEMIEDLPEPQQKAVKAILQVVAMKSTMWSGPYPHPETLKKYNDAFPNGAERIFLETQKQTDHRIKMESFVIPIQARAGGTGQWMGFIIALTFVIIAAFLIYTGHDTAGTILGTIDLVGLVIVFVLGKEPSSRIDPKDGRRKELKKPD